MTTLYHPILFSTPMVQAIDENRKTQTRRTKGLEVVNDNLDTILDLKLITDPDKTFVLIRTASKGTYKLKCPCHVGDVLWIRENFYTAENWDHLKPSLLKKYDINVYYKSDIGNENIPQLLHKGKMRPNIFLPAAYARTFLKIKSIRVERLQDISEEDAIAEGLEILYKGTLNEFRIYGKKDVYGTNCPLKSFETLWISINGYDSWNENPWVWVYEFKKIAKPEDFI